MLTIVDIIQLQCFPRFSLSLDSVTEARCYLDADGDRKLDMQSNVSGSIYVRYKILKARKLYNYYASTFHMNLHNLTTYHPESKEKIGNLQSGVFEKV